MSDYINREMAADCIVLECDNVTLEQARQAIKDCPSADVMPVRHGRWKPVEKEQYRRDDGSYMLVECSICGTSSLDTTNYPYCPNCGARMDGGNNE